MQQPGGAFSILRAKRRNCLLLLSDYGGPTGRNVTIDKSQTDLGGDAHSVAISLLGDGDLFPTASEFGYINIGFPGANPLDLLRPARLVSAVLSMYAGSTLIGSADFVAIFGASFSSLAPWDGFFISPGTSGGFLPVGALGVDRIELNLSLQELPEPQTLSLVTLSLLMLGLLRRRARGPG